MPCVARHPGRTGPWRCERVEVRIGDPVSAIPVLHRNLHAGRERRSPGKGRDTSVVPCHEREGCHVWWGGDI